VSLTGEAFLSTGGEAGRGQLEALLTDVGKAVADLSVAQASDPTGGLDLQAGLFRVAGADPERLLDAWVQAQQAATDERLEVASVEIAGRPTTRLIDPNHRDAGATYATSDGDTLVIVRTPDETLVAEVFAAI
jgi:hypothetical protein